MALFLVNAPACALLGADRAPATTQEAGADAANDAPADALEHDAATVEAGLPIDRGARCGVNGSDACGAFMVCDPTLGCVECAADRDCPAVAPFCAGGGCVECRTATAGADAGPSKLDEGCGLASPACWPAAPKCEARCSTDANCPSDAPFCDGATGQCWGCRADTDCAGGVCSPLTRRCVECIDDASCPSRLPRCHRLRGACVECSANADCGRKEPICDPATRECRVGCSSDAQCPGARCDVALAKCVAVNSDAGGSTTSPRDAGSE